jgi:hypothetical protein
MRFGPKCPTRISSSSGSGPSSCGFAAEDNSGRGSISVLRSIPSISIKEIRFLNGTDASIQFGTNYGGGAILVFTQ